MSEMPRDCEHGYAARACRVCELKRELAAARAEAEALRALLRRYRDETPLGHQPHMIAQEVDDVGAGEQEPLR